MSIIAIVTRSIQLTSTCKDLTPGQQVMFSTVSGNCFKASGSGQGWLGCTCHVWWHLVTVESLNSLECFVTSPCFLDVHKIQIDSQIHRRFRSVKVRVAPNTPWAFVGYNGLQWFKYSCSDSVKCLSEIWRHYRSSPIHQRWPVEPLLSRSSLSISLSHCPFPLGAPSRCLAGNAVRSFCWCVWHCKNGCAGSLRYFCGTLVTLELGCLGRPRDTGHVLINSKYDQKYSNSLRK